MSSSPDPIGRFAVFLFDATREPPPIDAALPSHRSFMRPLLDMSDAVYLYPGNDQDLLASYAPYLRRERGRYRLLDTGMGDDELLPLVNARGWARGSIVMLCTPERLDLSNLFVDVTGPFQLGNPRSANNPAAYAFCRRQASMGQCCVLISASNGFDMAEIIASGAWIERAYQLCQAQATPWSAS